MAKRWDSFTAPFRQSRVPFLVAEVVADGQGEMVDLVCRFANDAAAMILNLSGSEMKGRRLTHCFPARELEAFRPLQSVAFSGSSRSFPYTTVLGQQVFVTCYQLFYGAVACILDPCGAEEGRLAPQALSIERLPEAAAVLELGRRRLRCLSLNRCLCTLTGWSQKELLDRFAEDFTRLLEPEDRQSLIQSLLDALRSGQPPVLVLRLLHRSGSFIWVELRGELLRTQDGVSTFYIVFVDIDAQHQTRRQLESSLAQLQAARGQLSSLFAHLPGEHCLVRLGADGAVIPEQLSPGLAALLGLSVHTLEERIGTSPLSLVFPPDREDLCAAVAQARALGRPMQQLCRLQGDAPPVWVSLTAAEIAQENGERLIYVACWDQTRARETEARLTFSAQLCDLLLERTSLLLLDYDPVTDTAKIDFSTGSERRTLRLAEHYLQSLEEAPFIHPEDRLALADAVSRAVTQPVAERPEYRGDYLGSGWRWYRISWLRQIDGGGNVIRLIGKSEDVTAAKATARRFQQLRGAFRKLEPGVLALALLDLTENRILDGKAATRHLKSLLFGNSADACLDHLRENIPSLPVREEFGALFSRSALLAFYEQGQTQLCHEQLIGRDKNRVVWSGMEAVLIEHPETGHIVAFCTVRNTEQAHQSDAVLQALAAEYDAAFTVDAAGMCRLFAPAPAPVQPYRALAAGFLRTLPPSPQRAALRRAVQLEHVQNALETQPRHRIFYTAEPGAQPLELCWRVLSTDAKAKTLLATLRRVPRDPI